MDGVLPTPILRHAIRDNRAEDQSAVRHGQNRIETRRVSKRCQRSSGLAVTAENMREKFIAHTGFTSSATRNFCPTRAGPQVFGDGYLLKAEWLLPRY